MWANGFRDETLTSRGDMVSKRQLDEDSVDIIVGVQIFDDLDDLLSRGFDRDGDVTKFDPDLLSGFGLHAHISGRIGALPDLDDRQLGLEAGRCSSL